LLAVIAIIGILAALTIVAVSKARQMTASARCVSNFRQLGMAMLTFATDHKDTLPGSTSWVKSNFDLQSAVLVHAGDIDGDKNRLQHKTKLGPYMGTQAVRDQFHPLMVCPLWLSQGNSDPANLPNSLVLRTEFKPGGVAQGVQYPFKSASLASEGLGQKLTVMENPSRDWAMIETDQQMNLPGADKRMQGSSHQALCPPQPVHGNYRNVVFFDGHVGRLHLTTYEPL
jgi:prepilin-type processing-associated H-X9-DG protein